MAWCLRARKFMEIYSLITVLNIMNIAFSKKQKKQNIVNIATVAKITHDLSIEISIEIICMCVYFNIHLKTASHRENYLLYICITHLNILVFDIQRQLQQMLSQTMRRTSHLIHLAELV